MLLEKTQRRLFRLLFVLGCVAPTLAIGSWAVARFHPVYQSFLLDQVGQSLGVTITADQISTPRPGVFEAEGIRISRETEPTVQYAAQCVAQCDHLRVQRVEGNWQIVGGALRVTRSADSKRLMALLQDKLPTASPFRASFQSLAIDDAQGNEINRWERVRCEIAVSDESEESRKLAIWSADESNTALARIEIATHAEDSEIKIQFDTGPAGISCRLLAGRDSLAALRDAATFVGQGEATLDGSKQHGQVTGALSFTQVTMDEAGGFAAWDHVHIRLNEARWWGPVVTRLDATIEATNGSISPVLVWGMNQRLHCGATSELQSLTDASGGGPLPYDRFACNVRLDFSGLHLKGPGEETTLLSHAGQSLLREPEQPLPVFAVIQALWPHQTPELPATQEAQAMARRLPLSGEATFLK